MSTKRVRSLNNIYKTEKEYEKENEKGFLRRLLQKKKTNRHSAVYYSTSTGQISELTPALANVLQETHETSEVTCQSCQTDLNFIIDKTLQPMTSLSEMYSSLPRNWTASRDKKQKLDSKFQKTPDITTSVASIGKENITPAASFFVRAAQKLNLASKPKTRKSRKKKEDSSMEQNRYAFQTNFSELIMRTPPQAPPSLFKNGTVRRGDGHGKVRLILRIVDRKNKPETCLTVDAKKKQVLLRDSTLSTDGQKRFEKAPRLFSFDNIFDKDAVQTEICSGTLVDLLHTVVNGNDACLITYGYPKLGKSAIMIGRDTAPENIGIIPCAISWLYQLIDDRKQRTGARFSIRVSAVEIVGKSENLKDLLGEQGNGSISSNVTSPSVYLPRERASSIQLSDFTELRAPNAEKAAFFFDAAVAAKTSPITPKNEHGEYLEDPDERKNSNMIYTLHVYQYMIDKVGTGEIHGGRSRLHLIDLSGCSRKKKSRDTGQGTWLPLSALGNVIVSLSNGTKHIPHRDSKLTTLLREAMGSLSSRVTMIANVSQDPKHCFETLSTLQVASRIHRSRKKKSRYSSTSSSGGDSSCDEKKKHRRRCKPVTPLLVTEACHSDNVGESELTSTSAAEESCDTVIYLGPSGGAVSDRELTDFEHPPEFPKKSAIKSDVVSSVLTTNQLTTVPALGSNETSFNSSSLKRKDTKGKSNSDKDRSHTLPRRHTDEEPAPIIVNITEQLAKSPLEEHADTVLSSPTKTTPIDNKSDFQPSYQQKLNCFENNLNLIKYSDSLPIRGRKKSYSMQPHNNIEESSRKRTRSLRLNKLDERQCVSTNSSPFKRTQSFRDEYITRTASLDRTFTRHEVELVDGKICKNFKSTDTVSSVGTVENFERQLVSQIAERFALEDEFSYVDDIDPRLFNAQGNEKSCASEEFFIDDDLESIGAELDPSAPDNFNVYNYNSSLLKSTKSLVEKSEERDNDIIPCNNCIGECRCNVYTRDLPCTSIIQRRNLCDYDSAEDTDERTNKQLSLQKLRNRNSFSSCDSHLDHSPRNFCKRPPSEGVSSGYESMRCESSANIHAFTDNTYEKGKPALNKKDRVDEVFDSSREDNNRLDRAAHHRTQIKELIEERQDLKEELHQTLKKLVLNRVPLPDIDERLREITTQNKDTKKLLSRENRILERKVKVCKSHLELVTYFDGTPNQTPSVTPSCSPKKKSPYRKLSAKLKSKLTRNSSPSRKAYKVTSV